MANERLRTALTRGQWSAPALAEALNTDPKTVERWVTTGRTPHRRTAVAAAKLLGEELEYLWPELGRRTAIDEKHGEVVTVYAERSAVPNALYLSLLQNATESVDILVYAGLHLPEGNPSWPREMRRKCEAGLQVRIAFGDPESEEVRSRGEEEKVGAGLAARIRYALSWYQPILDCPNLHVGFHSTVLYNSILRFDDQMLVNPHVYGMGAFRAPQIHLRKIQGGPLFETYRESFEKVWAQTRPYDPEG
ncbi:helix-turn-helix transcriptional regulator [Pseudofrankia sp. DC12]|uniref:helix-turn-helix domain-containing protein n=1 Tax=Pseudofrankia sp. DC12 TaxID=683315 RepID=UPI0005F881CE|nr:helix-turn-helix transcriptional regulator [Pseudofrankia sp. DC12]